MYNSSLNTCANRFLSIVLVLSVLFMMQGCASLSKDECRTADWYAIGYEDGLRGYPAVRMRDHRKACAKHNVTPDLARYTNGRDGGLLKYCEPGNGYRLGRGGTDYGGVCPPDREPLFLDAYYAGRELHGMEERVKQLEREVSARQSELVQLHEDIAAVEAELVIAGTTRNAREALLVELRGLEHQALVVEEEMLAADAERSSQQAQYAEMSATSMYQE